MSTHTCGLCGTVDCICRSQLPVDSSRLQAAVDAAAKELQVLDLGIGADPLQFMIDKQRALHDRVTQDPELGWLGAAAAMTMKYQKWYGQDRVALDDDTLCLADNLQMMAVEAHEALQDLPWKKHKRDYGRAITEEEREKVLEELVDIQHFLLNSFRLCGVTDSREIARRYLSKNTTNHRRQDQGY